MYEKNGEKYFVVDSHLPPDLQPPSLRTERAVLTRVRREFMENQAELHRRAAVQHHARARANHALAVWEGTQQHLFAQDIGDLEARAEIYRQLQEILLVDLPWVPLFVANQYEAMKTRVQGFVHYPTGSNASFREVWLSEE